MAKKQVLLNDEARGPLKNGADELAEAVKITLGPKGRNVILDKKYGSPVITNDGKSIAREIEFEDLPKNVGARLLSEVALKASEMAGGGTATSTVLAQAIMREGIKAVVAGANPMLLKRGIDKATEAVVKSIRSKSKELKTHDEIAQIAAVASNNDLEVGNLIADAIDKVGRDGVVTIEEAKGVETGIEIVEGMQFDKGYISAYMVTDPEKMIAVLENPLILIYEHKISSIYLLINLLQKVMQINRPLLIIAEDVEAEALATLVINKLRDVIECVAVKAPGFGDRRKEMLMDIAIATGGQLISEELGFKLENVVIGMLGQARRVNVDKDSTIIIGGAGKKDDINKRANLIRKQIEETTSDYDREKLEQRLASLVSGVAQINIGAPTETALKEKKARAEDALRAVKSAISEGFVVGGGVTLLRSMKDIDNLGLTGDEEIGANILKRALEAPMRCIAANSGVEGSMVISMVKEADEDYGFNAITGKIENLISAGIIDPTKTVCSALQSAASVAGMMLTTDALITELPEEEPEEQE